MSGDENAISSAVLTATITSLKLLKTIRERQELIAKDNQTEHVSLKQNQEEIITSLHAIQKTQDQSLEAIQTILNLPKPEEFAEIQQSVNAINKTLNSFNVDDILKSIHTKIDESDQQRTIENQNQTKQVLTAVADSNKADNVATIKKLISGLMHMQDNIMELAKRVTVLSGNVKNVRHDSSKLNTTILENNARIRSMDLRMASFTKNSIDDEAPKDYDTALEFLESFSNDEHANTQKQISQVDELKQVTKSAQELDEAGESNDE
jgi:hypothetical protein